MTLIAPMLDITIPVHNEEQALPRCIATVLAHIEEGIPYPTRITIVDNASTDQTWNIATELARQHRSVTAIRLADKGRGNALAHAWSRSDAHILAYMDVDLSTGLNALLPLIAPLASGHSDLAIGTRLARASRVERGPKREIISRCYNLLLHATLQARFSDAQCGFKAIRADAACALLPLIEDKEWFFDTEMLLLGERAGLRIHEVPVDWVDDPDSRVDITRTAIADLRGMARIGKALAAGTLPLAEVRASLHRDTSVPGVPHRMLGQLARFALVGVASTIAYIVIYLLVRQLAGPQAANVLALLTTAVLNTAANRAYTFRVRGRARLGQHHAQGLGIFALGLALTSVSLWLLHWVAPGAPMPMEVSVLVIANLAATVMRFVLLRLMFRSRRSPAAANRPRAQLVGGAR